MIKLDEQLFEQNHKNISRHKNIEMVHLGPYSINTWFWSPYPLPQKEELDHEMLSSTTQNDEHNEGLNCGPALAPSDSHPVKCLYVCEFCLKYFFN
mmetsp:Transcript_4119/g.6975  ORF Transcript_4119/g.6975 Transcript_4119/m.6975 type:complete len:96 (+) Transcript_4119:1215-1502(+)